MASAPTSSALSIHDDHWVGMIIPGGGVLIGAMPLFVGLWLLAKGLGAETQLERLIVDMRESAMGGIVSSLLWAFASFASLLAILEVYREIAQTGSEMSGFEIGVEAMDSGLQWIVLASLAVAMSMVVLRWRRGTLSANLPSCCWRCCNLCICGSESRCST